MENYILRMMTKKYNKWFNNLPPLKDLILSFILNLCFWLVMRLLADQFIFDEKHSLKSNILHATWMSLFMMIPFNWKQIQQIFKPRNKKFQSQEMDNL
jgi:hypothetical protein